MLLLFAAATLQITQSSIRSNIPDYSNIQLPAAYDFLEEFKICDFGPITQECGSCYAHGPIKAMSHRFCRAKNKKFLLSAQYIVACDVLELGCKGGCSRSVFYFLEQHGATKQSCHQWKNITDFNSDYCGKCDNNEKMQLYTAKFGSTRQLTTVSQIKQQIYVHGPVSASVLPDDEMRSYQGGIYTYQVPNKTEIGTHSVEIIGWGVELDKPYWIVLNHYGEDWGEKGRMRIRMGQNDALIESYVYSAEPEII